MPALTVPWPAHAFVLTPYSPPPSHPPHQRPGVTRFHIPHTGIPACAFLTLLSPPLPLCHSPPPPRHVFTLVTLGTPAMTPSCPNSSAAHVRLLTRSTLSPSFLIFFWAYCTLASPNLLSTYLPALRPGCPLKTDRVLTFQLPGRREAPLNQAAVPRPPAAARRNANIQHVCRGGRDARLHGVDIVTPAKQTF